MLPPQNPELGPHDVHIWLIDLDISESDRHYLAQTLSTEEYQRAEKFAFELHRVRFIAGRGLLRTILGKYSGLKPASIRFRYNTYGKPALVSGNAGNSLYFNISHSNDKALFAVTRSGEIGVDIEFHNEQTDIGQAGSIAFSSTELAALRSQPPGRQHNVFFQFWTRKEALIKAIGQGLTLPLQKIDVSTTPEKPIVVPVEVEGKSREKNWHIRDIDVFPDYAAAVAVNDNEMEISCFSLPDLHFFK